MSGTLFDRFTNVWNRRQEARVAELEADKAQLIADGEFRDQRIAELVQQAEMDASNLQSALAGLDEARAERDDLKERNTALAEELAPFRAFVREHEAEAEAGDAEEGGGEEGPAPEEVEADQPRDERGRFAEAEPEAAE